LKTERSKKTPVLTHVLTLFADINQMSSKIMTS